MRPTKFRLASALLGLFELEDRYLLNERIRQEYDDRLLMVIQMDKVRGASFGLPNIFDWAPGKGKSRCSEEN